MLTDLELARRTSAHSAGADGTVEEVTGSRAVFAGVGSTPSETQAIGLHGPVCDADRDIALNHCLA